MLDRDDYCNLFEGKDIKPHQNGLLVYLLDQREENEKMISYFANTLGLPPFSVNSKYETPGFHPVEECIQPSVETWLKGFYDANFVLTDSFHACVFLLFSINHLLYLEMQSVDCHVSSRFFLHIDLQIG